MTIQQYQVAWITGASAGIGEALATSLAQDGMTIAASARSVEGLDALVADARRAGGGGRIDPFPLDVTDRVATKATVDAIEEKLGPIDLAVLNAGTHTPMGLDDFNVDTVMSLMTVNHLGVANGLEALLDRMRRRGRGHIAVVASLAGYRGLPTAAAYGPSKAALINMCESLYSECRQAGIRLQVINPGFVDTPLTARNPFPMPDLISADRAAHFIRRGLTRDRFEIAFPPRFAWALKFARLLPYPAYFALVRKMTGL